MYAADAIHPDIKLSEKLRSLYRLRGGADTGNTVDLTIRKPYLELLSKLGNPQEHLPPVIHVAGTNGKGSVIAMIRAVFEAAGYKVHAYTSPHLFQFNERIVLEGHEITDSRLEELLDEVLQKNDGAPLTFFEITTALALTAFAQTPADVLLLETGLGGRLDCTNVIEKPAATVITPVSFDHMEFLGNTLPEIAAEKAGIMKPGIPCVLGRQETQAMAVFEEKAKELSCPLYKSEDENLHIPALDLQGDHQIQNAQTALTALSVLKKLFTIQPDLIEDGLKNIHWPGRLDCLYADSEKEIWFDGAHNEAGAKALARQIKAWKMENDRPIHLVTGMMKTKDHRSFLAPLLPLCDSLTLTAVPEEPTAMAPEALKEIALSMGFHGPVSCEPDPDKAVRHYNHGYILIVGSFYLLSHIRRST